MNISPATLHDIWLFLTVIILAELLAVGIYLWKSFNYWFFRALALLIWSVALEVVSAEVKNIFIRPEVQFEIALQWLLGRAQEAVICGGVLGYLLFGRNGHIESQEKQSK